MAALNFKKIGIFFALKALKTLLLDKITYPPMQAFINPNYKRLEQIATLVTDKNPQDEQQLAEFWDAEESGIVTDSLETAKEIILQKVKNQEFAQLLAELITQIQEDQGEEEEPPAPAPRKA
jgi:hypothetical protein